MTTPVTVLVLAGGASRRFGSDKLAADLGGRSVLDHCLSGMPSAWALVVVGPSRAVPVAARFVLESPPGGGPLAGVAAGLAAVETEVVCVAAGDTPRAGEVLPLLVAALEADPTVSAAVLLDGERRANPLVAAYRTSDLRAALPDSTAGLPARTLLTLPHREVRAAFEVLDVDTREDLDAMASGRVVRWEA